MPTIDEYRAVWRSHCLKDRGRELTGKKRHYCPEWDYLTIDETTPEWPCGPKSHRRLFLRLAPHDLAALISHKMDLVASPSCAGLTRGLHAPFRIPLEHARQDLSLDAARWESFAPGRQEHPAEADDQDHGPLLKKAHLIPLMKNAPDSSEAPYALHDSAGRT